VEFFLASSVPYSQIDALAIDVQLLVQKWGLQGWIWSDLLRITADTYLHCRYMAAVEFIFDVPQDEARFPHASLTQQNNFEIVSSAAICHALNFANHTFNADRSWKRRWVLSD
jgi:hypothetical protein